MKQLVKNKPIMTITFMVVFAMLVSLVPGEVQAAAKKPVIPLIFYSFVVSSYILNAQIGFRISWNIAYCFAAMFAVVVLAAVIRRGSRYSIIGPENK